MEGRCVKIRVLLDQGSTLNFISESLRQTLRAKQQRTDRQIHYIKKLYRPCEGFVRIGPL